MLDKDKRRKYNNNWKRQRCKERKAQGLCVSCGNPSNGRRSCDVCLSKVRELQNYRRAANLCSRCGQELTNGKKICEKCLVYYSNHAKEKRKKRISAGICSECGKPATNRKLCEAHEVKRKEQIEANYAKKEHRRKTGICEYCGGKENICTNKNRKTSVCETCYLKWTSRHRFKTAKRWNELRGLFENQSVCPYTGIALVLGLNTSLDHIIPRGRGGSDDITNLQFVYSQEDFDVNFMKGSMTDSEFRESIKTIYQNITKKENENEKL